LSENLLNLEKLIELRQQWRAAGKRIVFTNGVFDLLHLGHVQYLTAARAMGDLLVIGLNSDGSVKQLKGPTRPLVAEQERAEVLLALRPVDYVTIFEETTAENILRQLQPEIYVKGGDYTLQDQLEFAQTPKPLPEEPVVRSYGGLVRLVPFLPGHSTAELIAKILQVYAKD